MRVHIKFNQFLFPPGEKFENKSVLGMPGIKLWVKLAPNNVATSAPIYGSDSDIKCTHEWSFDANSDQQKLEIQLKKGNVLSGDTLLASLTLPLTWFQKQTVVRYWYPMERGANKQPLFADISVQYASRNVSKFAAPLGNLLVIPSWQIPVPVEQQPAIVPPQAGVPPQGYAPPPQGYAPPPQGYAPPPQGYAPPPQGYAPPPQGYAPPPQGYAPQYPTLPPEPN